MKKNTIQTRLDIGFDKIKDNWKFAPIEYDNLGSLNILGHPVMERWEENYMRKLAQIVCSNGGDILEIGFGLGISARQIQTHEIKNHVIIEANKNVFKEVLSFAREANSNVISIHSFWEECIDYFKEESFDGILFDTYPLVENEIHKNHYPFFKFAYKVLKKNGILTYYSDEKNVFSKEHIKELKNAGFYNINSEVLKVNPPVGCKYWNEKTIIAPIIVK